MLLLPFILKLTNLNTMFCTVFIRLKVEQRLNKHAQTLINDEKLY